MPTLESAPSMRWLARSSPGSSESVIVSRREADVATRDDVLARTFVDVADTLVADFDLVDFLTVLTIRCVELFDLAAAGLMLSDAIDGVRVAASSNERMQLL